ncbi:MAG: hypothetical protein M3032_09215 [Verrucomicrobiota bacterium]|nr:hypothetical protein [Verrucomicrobiota bacterium]
MALQLNLLHEQISEKRQRQRDPLKLGMFALVGVGLLMALFYMWRGYQTLEVKRRLSATQAEWAKIEPKATAAKKRSEQLNDIINTTKVLDEMIDTRFFWAPFLERVARCVAPNAQLTSIEGTVRDDHKVSVAFEGIAAGREPRAAAEELRQLLSEQLGQIYTEVKVEFRTLEDLDTIVKIAGSNMAMAHYSLTATFTPAVAPKPTPAAGQRSPKTK